MGTNSGRAVVKADNDLNRSAYVSETAPLKANDLQVIKKNSTFIVFPLTCSAIPVTFKLNVC